LLKVAPGSASFETAGAFRRVFCCTSSQRVGSSEHPERAANVRKMKAPGRRIFNEDLVAAGMLISLWLPWISVMGRLVPGRSPDVEKDGDKP